MLSDVHFLTCFIDAKTAAKWKKLTRWWPWACRLQTYWSLRVDNVNSCDTGWMALLTQWTWVWVNSGSWWWTGRPGMLQSMGVTKSWTRLRGWTELNVTLTYYLTINQSENCAQADHIPWDFLPSPGSYKYFAEIHHGNFSFMSTSCPGLLVWHFTIVAEFSFTTTWCP